MELQLSETEGWQHRVYTINAMLSDIESIKSQVSIQNESIHNVIILDVEYFIAAGKARIHDKVRIKRRE